ncbi:unnamed protein product [Brassica oleracea]
MILADFKVGMIRHLRSRTALDALIQTTAIMREISSI